MPLEADTAKPGYTTLSRGWQGSLRYPHAICASCKLLWPGTADGNYGVGIRAYSARGGPSMSVTSSLR